LAERFGLPSTPRRVEVFDNSHISGTNAVGAMIVAGPEGFVKGQYRKFNIKWDATTPGDDYAMMREVLTRRFKRLAEPPSIAHEASECPRGADLTPVTAQDSCAVTSRIEAPARTSHEMKKLALGMIPLAPDARVARDLPPEAVEDDLADGLDETEDTGALAPETFPDRPDVVFVDGGQGQLSIASEVMSELSITGIALIGVAKGPDRDAGREHFHVPGSDKPFMLEPRDPVLYFVQRLRDEAHRFAIGTHRAKRSKALSANPLDEIEGIGPTRKRALLKHFGSAKAVSRAGVEDLKEVEGISSEMAQKIYDFFHERRS
jgi:excinuclease ABC subunit C